MKEWTHKELPDTSVRWYGGTCLEIHRGGKVSVIQNVLTVDQARHVHDAPLLADEAANKWIAETIKNKNGDG